MASAPMNPRPQRILDFDVETVAIGFADPEWVPQAITCAAWSWIGEDEVYSRISTPAGIYGRNSKKLRRKMLLPLLEAIREADMVTGHNLIRFDLKVIMSECLRLGLPLLGRTYVQDTIRLKKTKGFKKGQDNLLALLDVGADKLALNWQQWDDAYHEVDWATIRERCESDVLGHKLLREKMIENGWLQPPVWWKP